MGVFRNLGPKNVNLFIRRSCLFSDATEQHCFIQFGSFSFPFVVILHIFIVILHIFVVILCVFVVAFHLFLEIVHLFAASVVN